MQLQQKKTVLTVFKKEYDELICAIKKSDCDGKLSHGKLKVMVAQLTSLMTVKEELSSFRKGK